MTDFPKQTNVDGGLSIEVIKFRVSNGCESEKYHLKDDPCHKVSEYNPFGETVSKIDDVEPEEFCSICGSKNKWDGVLPDEYTT